MTAEQLEEALSLTGTASVQYRLNLIPHRSADELTLREKRCLASLPRSPDGALTGGSAGVATGVGRRGVTPVRRVPGRLPHHPPALLPTPGTGSNGHLDDSLDAAELRLSGSDMKEIDMKELNDL